MSIQAKIIADSISPEGIRLTTMQLLYPRFIHAEFMTHRVFSRNASSSRAIPVKKMISMIRNDPAMPIHWGLNEPGMQANKELCDEFDPILGTSQKQAARNLWRRAAREAAQIADHMVQLGLHKQVANRILEPFQHIQVVVTATEWQNFFDLRAHKDAQPEIQALACAMRDAMAASTPKPLIPGEWHLPYVSELDARQIQIDCMANRYGMDYWETIKRVSAARCCRVSYLKHDGSEASVADDLELCDRLAKAKPIHASPFEHQATPDTSYNLIWNYPFLHGNFYGWIQNRKELEKSFE